jgi:hypothetical protein
MAVPRAARGVAARMVGFHLLAPAVGELLQARLLA